MKLIADKRIRQYELTYILPVNLTSDEAKAVHEKIASVVKKQKGTVVATEDWGKKTLAYGIVFKGKAQTEGIYTHLVLECDSEVTPSIERSLALEPLLMRHLLVIAEPSPVKDSKTDENQETA